MTVALVQASINGGGYASGFLTALPSQTVALRIANSGGVTSYVWEIYDYPPGFSLPAGWSNLGGVYTFNGSVPPVFTTPASGSNNWGPFAIRLRINGNPLQFSGGTLNPAYNPIFTDEGTIVDVQSPLSGMVGLSYNQGSQYDPLRAWVGAVMQALRKLDGGGGGAGTLGGSVPTKQIYKSPVTWMTSQGITPGTIAGSFSVGSQFQLNRAGLTVTGVHTYWSGAALTLKASLWGDATTRLASGSLAVASNVGWVFIPFTTPYIATQGNTNGTDTVLTATVWETSGTVAPRLSNGKNVVQGYPTFPNSGGPDLTWVSWSLFHAGDAIPDTDGAPDCYPVEPVIVNWSAKTSASFVMPASGSTVNVTFNATVGVMLHAGMSLLVQSAGLFLVASVGSDPVISILNIGDPYNAAPGTVIGPGALVI